jgi:hypothetical protein
MTINHKAAADSYLEACLYDTYDMTNAEKVSLAQVHATLALVEQQRIANLIALASITGPESEAELTPLETTAWRALGDAETGEMLPSIRKGLGL